MADNNYFLFPKHQSLLTLSKCVLLVRECLNDDTWSHSRLVCPICVRALSLASKRALGAHPSCGG